VTARRARRFKRELEKATQLWKAYVRAANAHNRQNELELRARRRPPKPKKRLASEPFNTQ
jgi:hypothetical protein